MHHISFWLSGLIFQSYRALEVTPSVSRHCFPTFQELTFCTPPSPLPWNKYVFCVHWRDIAAAISGPCLPGLMPFAGVVVDCHPSPSPSPMVLYIWCLCLFFKAIIKSQADGTCVTNYRISLVVLSLIRYVEWMSILSNVARISICSNMFVRQFHWSILNGILPTHSSRRNNLLNILNRSVKL